MKKNNIIILSLLIFLTLGIVLFNYANQLTSLIAEAVAPNPGHSWSELECTTDLCVTATGVGIGTTSPVSALDVSSGIITIQGETRLGYKLALNSISLTAGNWYRIATLSASNAPNTVKFKFLAG